MGNKKSREFMKQRDGLDTLLRAQTEDRGITSDVFVRGIGVRRMQLLYMPSVMDGFSWDVRQRGDTWTLYRGVVPQDSCCVRGLEQLNAEQHTLAKFFAEVCNISIPLKPDLSNMGGADGDTFQLAVFGDLYTEWRFQWWTDAPTQWRPMIDIAERMMAYFGTLHVVANQA